MSTSPSQYGTAPRRVRPGVWVTANGRKLTRAGSLQWENYLSSGKTDGFGHFAKVAVGPKMAPPPGAVTPTSAGVGKVYLPRRGESQPDYTKRVGGILRLHAAAQQAETAKNTPAFSIPRIGQTIMGFNALTGGEAVARDVTKGLQGEPTWGLALDAATLLPVLRGPKALAVGVKALTRGAKVGEAAQTARTAYRTSTPIRTTLKAGLGVVTPEKRLVANAAKRTQFNLDKQALRQTQRLIQRDERTKAIAAAKAWNAGSKGVLSVTAEEAPLIAASIPESATPEIKNALNWTGGVKQILRGKTGEVQGAISYEHGAGYPEFAPYPKTFVTHIGSVTEGKGVGSSLMRQAARDALARGEELWAQASNPGAVTFNLKLGFGFENPAKGLMSLRGDALEQFAHESPLKEGYIRLYRGEGAGQNAPITQTSGLNFTPQRGYAKAYQQHGGVLKYVDVSITEWKKLTPKMEVPYHDPNLGFMSSASEYVLPKEIASRSRVVGLQEFAQPLRLPRPAGETSRLASEAGGVSLGAFKREPYSPRLLTEGELTAQVGIKARSRITNALIERPADRISLALQKSKWVRDTPGARLLTSGERLMKYRGRSQKIERGRAEARVGGHIKAIEAVAKDSPDDVANFWYAQIPKSHRNAEGLKLIAQLQIVELKAITSGERLAELNQWEENLKTAMAGAKDMAERGPILRDLEQVKVLKTDLPNRIEDITTSLSQLRHMIENPPAVNNAAIEAAGALSREGEKILTEAGRLKPDVAAARLGAVSREIGLTPTGEENYIGHRLARPKGVGSPFQPSGGVGRVSSPKGRLSENKMLLAKTGRLRPSLYVAAEDWKAAQIFHEANIARSDLSKPGRNYIPGEKLDLSKVVLMNPKGRTFPAHWKLDEFAQLGEGAEDPELIRAQAKEILSGFIAEDPKAIAKMLDEASASGVQWNELKVVPRRYVDRYYSQFRAPVGRTPLAKGYDVAVDAMATSIVFARIGYIPKNLVQNIIMAVPHQGIFLPINLVRMGQVMRDPELRRLIHAEVGFSTPTAALGAEAGKAHGYLQKVAGFVSKTSDEPLRIAAWLHEAAAEGVIAKQWKSTLLTEADRKSMLDHFYLPKHEPLLNDIRGRAVESMGDFSRMTPAQTRVARRYAIIPSWLMAGSRYPFHFAASHPIRSALLAYAAMAEPGAPDNLQFGKPWDEYFSKGLPSWLQGVDVGGSVLRTSSISPVSTPLEIAKAAYGGSPDTAISYINPLIASGYNILGRQVSTPSGTFKTGYGQAIQSNLLRLIPNYDLVHDLIKPTGTGTFPEDKTAWGRLKREIGIIPIQVKRVVTPAQAINKKIDTASIDEKWKAQLRHALTLKTQANLSYAKIERGTDPGPDREVQKLDALLEVLKDSTVAQQTIAYFEKHPELKKAYARQARRALEKSELMSDAFAWLNKQK